MLLLFAAVHLGARPIASPTLYIRNSQPAAGSQQATLVAVAIVVALLPRRGTVEGLAIHTNDHGLHGLEVRQARQQCGRHGVDFRAGQVTTGVGVSSRDQVGRGWALPSRRLLVHQLLDQVLDLLLGQLAIAVGVEVLQNLRRCCKGGAAQ